MFQGFYNLASGMLTQNRNLNVVSNNMSNMLTPGYKKDTMLSSTFQEELMSRTGNLDRSNTTGLQDTSMFRSPTTNVTDFSQGAFEPTNQPLDFALENENGFFQIQTQNNDVVYTRNGSFIIDDQGYLALAEKGRVIGTDGPIYLGTDDIQLDETGMIHRKDGTAAGRFAIVDFADKTQLRKQDGSVFTANANANPIPSDTRVRQRILERSNVDAMVEMMDMLESQRTLQSASQMMKMYDQLMGKAATEIGRV